MLKVSVTHDIVAPIGSFSFCSSVHSTDREVFCYIRMLSGQVHIVAHQAMKGRPWCTEADELALGEQPRRKIGRRLPDQRRRLHRRHPSIQP